MEERLKDLISCAADAIDWFGEDALEEHSARLHTRDLDERIMDAQDMEQTIREEFERQLGPNEK